MLKKTFSNIIYALNVWKKIISFLGNLDMIRWHRVGIVTAAFALMEVIHTFSYTAYDTDMLQILGN